MSVLCALLRLNANPVALAAPTSIVAAFTLPAKVRLDPTPPLIVDHRQVPAVSIRKNEELL